MDWLKELSDFAAQGEVEQAEQRVLLEYCRAFPQNILTRENEFAHLTSSGFILNPSLDRMLMVYHNIYDSWSWSGGHCDGDPDFLAVALREAREETGLTELYPQTGRIISLDLLSVNGHWKRGKYVCPHLHLSVAYLLIAPEDQPLRVKPDENSGVAWFAVDELEKICGEPLMMPVYQKIIRRAQEQGRAENRI